MYHKFGNNTIYCQICDTYNRLFSFMVTTNEILNFAFTNKVFTRKELIAKLKREDQIGSPGSLSEQLNRLLKSGQLVRINRGVYKLTVNARKNFSVLCT